MLHAERSVPHSLPLFDNIYFPHFVSTQSILQMRYFSLKKFNKTKKKPQRIDTYVKK